MPNEVQGTINPHPLFLEDLVNVALHNTIGKVPYVSSVGGLGWQWFARSLAATVSPPTIIVPPTPTATTTSIAVPEEE